MSAGNLVLLHPTAQQGDCPACTLIAARHGTVYGALRCRTCFEKDLPPRIRATPSVRYPKRPAVVQ